MTVARQTAAIVAAITANLLAGPARALKQRALLAALAVLAALVLVAQAGAADAPDVSLFIGGPSLIEPQGIAVDPQGNIWVTDSLANRVRKLAPDGTPLLTFGRTGAGNGEFSQPMAIAVGPGGVVYVADFGANRVPADRFAECVSTLS